MLAFWISPVSDNLTTALLMATVVMAVGGFFALLLPSAVNWFVPALLMSFAFPNEQPAVINEKAQLSTAPGSWLGGS